MAGPGAEHGLWQRIAASFSRTRQRPWRHVVDFLTALPPGARVLDLMGGNGRHLGAAGAAGLQAVLVDWSGPAVRIAAAAAPEAGVAIADATCLPLRTAAFDACVCVAALHSIPSAELRAQALAEMRRVVRPGGRAQITVWSRTARRFAADSTAAPAGPAPSGDVPAPAASPLGALAAAPAPTPIDVAVPWRADGHDEMRRYHLYTGVALRAACEAAGWRVASLRELALGDEQPDNLVLDLR